MGIEATLARLKTFSDLDSSVIRALVAEPWAISEAGRRQLAAMAMQALQTRPSQPLNGTRQACVRDGVAIVPVSGPLTGKATWFSAMFGGCDYETIGQDLTVAMGNDDVRAALLDVDSPGGLVTGAHDTSNLIRSFRGKGKPIYAFVGGTCASAAYWLASACDKIIVSPTALVGSIGCFASLIDDSQLMATLGIKVYDVANDQSPFKVLDPANEEDRARVKTWVTDQASVFIGDVAAGRGRSDDEVKSKFGRGDLMVGAAAQKAGLVDAIGDFESVLAALAATPAQTGAQANSSFFHSVSGAMRQWTGDRAIGKALQKLTAKPSKAAATVSKAQQPRAPRAEKKGDPMPDMEKLKEHAKALHDAAHDDEHEAAGPMCKAMAPHMKALHEEMGEDSPFYKKDGDGDDDDDDAKALVAELGGSPKAAAGALAALKEQAADAPALRKQNADLKARLDKIELKSMLDEAMVDGRISKAQRTGLESKDIEFVRGFIALQSPKTEAAKPAGDAAAKAHAKKSVEQAKAGTGEATPVAAVAVPDAIADVVARISKSDGRKRDAAATVEHATKVYGVALGAPVEE